jgi:hypothetical protein
MCDWALAGCGWMSMVVYRRSYLGRVDCDLLSCVVVGMGTALALDELWLSVGIEFRTRSGTVAAAS